MTTRHLFFIAAAAAATLAPGCRGSRSSTEQIIATARPTYGYAPVSHPALRLQPDVRLVPGGSAAIRAVSADGLTWRLDGAAQGVRDLQVGQVMFATSRAVGRIVRMEPVDGEVSVTVEPVTLTEVVRDAKINLTQEIPLDALTVEKEPDLPVLAGARPSPAAAREYAPIYRHAVARTFGGAPRLVLMSDSAAAPNIVKGSGKVTVGNWEIEIYGKSDQKTSELQEKVGIKLQRRLFNSEVEGGTGEWSTSGGVKAGVDLGLLTRKLTVKMAADIQNGQLDSTTFLVDGLEQLDVAVVAGMGDLIENGKARVEVPIKWTIEFPPGPETGYIPFIFEIKFKYLIELGFGSKHSSITAKGRYQLSGPIGIDHGKVVAPTVTPLAPLLDSMDGIAPGITGVVAAVEIRVLTGIGTSAAMAGPYTKLVTAVGLTRGSALAAPAPMCKAVTFKVDAGAGLGFQFSRSVGESLQKLLGKRIRFELEVPEITATAYNKTFVRPDVPACYF
jgi:hypothetical protein